MGTKEKPTIGIIILAGGKGTRMQSEEGLPKVLAPLYGQPLISHLLHSIESVRASMPPIIVVGYRGDLVKQTLGPRYQYAYQEQQLGTGHAVMQARAIAQEAYEHVVILYGDQPHIPSETVNELIDTQLREKATISMMTVTVPDFNGWRTRFMHYGRIIRDERGDIIRIVEYKDATEEERAVRELNPGYYCFKAEWLWENLNKLQNRNVQGEYYLTDMLELAISSGEKVASFTGDPLSALGVNTKEELDELAQVLNGTYTE